MRDRRDGVVYQRLDFALRDDQPATLRPEHFQCIPAAWFEPDAAWTATPDLPAINSP